MPDIQRLPIRLNCNGLDLTHPIDRMPEGSFPYLFNARVLEEGRIDGRPGYTHAIAQADAPNSIRRLNDTSKVFAPAGYTYVGGGATGTLYAGNEAAYNQVDSGYSGNPLSLIPFRPEQSPQSWMYVYDANKSVKVRPDGVVRALGLAPPTTDPAIEYGAPNWIDINTAQATTGWTFYGASTAITLQDRTNGSTPTINSILYNSGSTGWACINPVITQSFWMGERMKVILNDGGGNRETVVVREIHPAIDATTIAAIQYDSGSTGACSIVLANYPANLKRNSLIRINAAETVRVLAVIPDPSGSVYSIRCSTAGAFTVGQSVSGLLSWYVYTVQNHAATEPIASGYIQVSHPTKGIGGITVGEVFDASTINGRPVDLANDYLHLSIFLQNPQNVVTFQILINLDATPNVSFANPGNSYIFSVPLQDLIENGASGDSWADITIPLSAGVRSGQDFTRTLANITAIAVQITTTGACAYGFDWWYLFGTYGPVIQPNSPVGLQYQSRFRIVATGEHSVPGPLNRFELFPLRESVIITPPATAVAGVDVIDIYRIGGAVSSPLFIGSVVDNSITPNSLTDTIPDSQVLQINQPPDLTALQPWPVLVPPISGTCNIVGTTLTVLTGGPLPAKMLNNTAVLIGGVAYLTFGQPRSTTVVELTLDAGNQAAVPFIIASPTVAATPLPYAFGPLEGPFAPVVFALGDPNNGGVVYFSNFSDADSAADTNTLEVAPPSTDLVSGAVWNGMAFAGSRNDVYAIRFSYLTTIGASNNTSFQWARVPTPSGMWSRWACCACPLGIAYLGIDGIYITTESGGVNISDAMLYPLFPHDGAVAESVSFGTNIILPVDMTQLAYLRLSYCDESLRFSYIDTGSNVNTLIYEIYKKRWFLNNYANQITAHYQIESSAATPIRPEILMLAIDSHDIKLAGGNTDDGAAINTIVLTPSADGGDERGQKLYLDTVTQADGNGTLQLAASFDNAQSFSPVLNIACSGTVQQTIQNISALSNLALHRNIGAKYAWTGGPDGPRVYAFEVSGFAQPYLSTFFVTQFIDFSFPGWKHLRRMFPALISTADVLLTIKTQDGRTYGPYTIPSTAGQFKIQPQMLDSGIKDLAFALQLDGRGTPFALFLSDFTCEVKQWVEESYIDLAVFRS